MRRGLRAPLGLPGRGEEAGLLGRQLVGPGEVLVGEGRLDRRRRLGLREFEVGDFVLLLVGQRLERDLEALARAGRGLLGVGGEGLVGAEPDVHPDVGLALGHGRDSLHDEAADVRGPFDGLAGPAVEIDLHALLPVLDGGHDKPLARGLAVLEDGVEFAVGQLEAYFFLAHRAFLSPSVMHSPRISRREGALAG